MQRKLVDEKVAAEYCGLSVFFLRMARYRGYVGKDTPPPPYLKLGHTIRYDLADLDRWLEERRVDPATRKTEAVSRGRTRKAVRGAA